MRPVVLVGFMAAGKTQVGQRLAKKLRCEFVDLDAIIEARAEMPIAEIFRRQTEAGFRALERQTLRDVLALEEPMVLALGGGTFVDDSSRALLRQITSTIFLRASVETLERRLRGAPDARPMLQREGTTMASIGRLLASREPAYLQADFHIDTDERSLSEVVDDVLVALLGLASTSAPSAPLCVGVETQHPYVVELHDDAGPWLRHRIEQLTGDRPLALVTDTNLAQLHGQALIRALEPRRVSMHVVPAGEAAKTLSSLGALYADLSDCGLTRDSVILALGGGTVGDSAGFAAATFLRGIDFVQLPTTTLAVVDASVGGKVAINLPAGKNLVGAFHQPLGVLVATSFLRTQPAAVHREGLVEALKMACCLDATLFSAMTTNASDLLRQGPKLKEVMLQAIAQKARIVARDEREHGVRAVLNYGHTVGHALEAGSDFSLPHGEAVAMGMCAEAEWAHGQGKNPGWPEELASALRLLGFTRSWRDYAIDVSALRHDKKRQGGSIQIPIVDGLGSYSFVDVQLAELERFVSDHD